MIDGHRQPRLARDDNRSHTTVETRELLDPMARVRQRDMWRPAEARVPYSLAFAHPLEVHLLDQGPRGGSLIPPRLLPRPPGPNVEDASGEGVVGIEPGIKRVAQKLVAAALSGARSPNLDLLDLLRARA